MSLISLKVFEEAAGTAALPHMQRWKKENICAKVGIFLSPEKKEGSPSSPQFQNNEIKAFFFFFCWEGQHRSTDLNILIIKAELLFGHSMLRKYPPCYGVCATRASRKEWGKAI